MARVGEHAKRCPNDGADVQAILQRIPALGETLDLCGLEALLASVDEQNE